MRFPIIIALFSVAFLSGSVCAQQPTNVQVFDPELNQLVDKKTVNKERELRYRPEGEDFVIVNGTAKFNRALYGTHTGFRVETGDVPEFALYLPRMGGNLSFSIENNHKSIKLNAADLLK